MGQTSGLVTTSHHGTTPRPFPRLLKTMMPALLALNSTAWTAMETCRLKSLTAWPGALDLDLLRHLRTALSLPARILGTPMTTRARLRDNLDGLDGSCRSSMASPQPPPGKKKKKSRSRPSLRSTSELRGTAMRRSNRRAGLGPPRRARPTATQPEGAGGFADGPLRLSLRHKVGRQGPQSALPVRTSPRTSTPERSSSRSCGLAS